MTREEAKQVIDFVTDDNSVIKHHLDGRLYTAAIYTIFSQFNTDMQALVIRLCKIHGDEDYYKWLDLLRAYADGADITYLDIPTEPDFKYDLVDYRVVRKPVHTWTATRVFNQGDIKVAEVCYHITAPDIETAIKIKNDLVSTKPTLCSIHSCTPLTKVEEAK